MFLFFFLPFFLSSFFFFFFFFFCRAFRLRFDCISFPDGSRSSASSHSRHHQRSKSASINGSPPTATDAEQYRLDLPESTPATTTTSAPQHHHDSPAPPQHHHDESLAVPSAVALPSPAAQLVRTKSRSKSRSTSRPRTGHSGSSRSVGVAGVQTVADQAPSNNNVGQQTMDFNRSSPVFPVYNNNIINNNNHQASSEKGSSGGGALRSHHKANRSVFSVFRGRRRDRSPKTTEPGVLGKGGTRHIIS